MSKILATGFTNVKGLPIPAEEVERGQDFVKWGKKNDYPFYLVEMFQGSAWHQGILKTKTYYIAGGGIEVVSGQLEEFLENKYSDFNIEEVLKKCAFDFELFDAYAIAGTWNKEGTRVVRWEHINVDDVRMNIDESMYYLSDDWCARKQSKEKTNFREIPPLDKKKKQGKFLIYYKSPSKKMKGELGLYPKPTYLGALTAINTDVLISKYHLHEIQNGFKGGTIVNMANGIPETEEEARAIRDNIKGTSTNIEDSNQVIITFSNGQDDAPTILPLNGNDLADRYNMTEQSVQQNILVGHSATNPLLFGIKTEGQLGGATELLESYEIFKSLYVNSRQESLEWGLNLMVELSGQVGELKLKDAKPIQIEETPVQATPEDAALSQIKEGFRDAQKDLKVFAEYGRSKEGFKVVKSVSVSSEFTSKDVEKMEKELVMMFDTIGEVITNLTDLDKNVLSLLKSGQDGSSITKALDVPLKDVAESINKLTDLNLLIDGKTSDIGESVLDRGEVDIEQYEVVYSYEKRPGIKGDEKLPTTRDFCATLLEFNKFYTRQEIDTISSRINRDVWRYRGGFYHNPDTNRTTPWCRHEWRQTLVRK